MEPDYADQHHADQSPKDALPFPPAMLDDATPPIEPADAVIPTSGRSPESNRGVAFGFALMGVAIVGFATWWSQKLAANHMLALHGCACGRLSRENMASFGLLPTVSILIADGARRAAIVYALVVTRLCVAATCVAYGILWALYFGLLHGQIA
ncbi:MAG: hypothetical protein JWM57_665 [Phycisphaerales bacterium]|nr:hypothetical protein [Phycisphaerales bacterium]